MHEKPSDLDMAKPRLGIWALPDFLVIGAQKSATTSLLAYMGQHPQVKLGFKKATHYFDLHPERSLAWYARHFPLTLPVAGRRWITGESCPSYVFLPEVPERVKAALPQVKLIAILRHPVKRLVSQYYHEKRKSRAAPSFADWVAQSRGMGWPVAGDTEFVRQNAAVPRGYYAQQLSHWLTRFPQSSLGVFTFEELTQEPQKTMNAVFRFLGLPEAPVDTSRVLNSGNASSKEPIDPHLLGDLDSLYRQVNRDLPAIAGRSFPWWPEG